MTALARSSAMALCLLVFASSAYAECAWVLWFNGTYLPPGAERVPGRREPYYGRPVRWGAYESSDKCMAQARAAAKGVLHATETETHVGNSLYARTKDGTGEGTLMCYPDTVDLSK